MISRSYNLGSASNIICNKPGTDHRLLERTTFVLSLEEEDAMGTSAFLPQLA